MSNSGSNLDNGIWGNALDKVIDGGGGNDLLVGGGGIDTFVFHASFRARHGERTRATMRAWPI